MLARGVTAQQLQLAADTVGVKLYELRKSGTGLRFRIVPVEGKYQKTSSSYFSRGRKCHAVCWHGHRDFLRELFEVAPNAVVITSLARYDGVEGFEANYEGTDRNVGPQISPIRYSECCGCPS